MDGSGPASKVSVEPEAEAAPAVRERPRIAQAPPPEAAAPPREQPLFRECAPSPIDRERLLTTKVKDLALQISGTKVERMVEQLYRELTAAGISFRPLCYLSDEWGCPDTKPLIGIPFYLADEKLGDIEGEVSEVREDEKESVVYLRHEAGHAFCYAYELYKREDFLALFGPYARPYLEDYKVKPFSRSFVRHIPGWYAQKHPDEDFAETFAVFITPGQGWRQTYATWPAMRKLEYVEARIKECGDLPPLVPARAPELPDVPVEAMEETVGELFRRDGPPAEVGLQLEEHFDGDLRQIFDHPGPPGVRAADLLEAGRKQIVTAVAYWTGLARPGVRALVLHLMSRCRALDLYSKPGSEWEAVSRFSVLVTTLAMNRVYSGRFLDF